MTKTEQEGLVYQLAEEQHKALMNIVLAGNWVTNHYNALLRPYGLSLQQFSVLRILWSANGKMNMHALKEQMLEKSPNATRLTDKLIQKGYLERERCNSDRRVVYVEITDGGKAFMEKVMQKLGTQFDAISAQLRLSDAQVINQALEQLLFATTNAMR